MASDISTPGPQKRKASTVIRRVGYEARQNFRLITAGTVITGDSVLVAFASALSAIDCAVEVQGVMIAESVGVPEDERLLFRMGINVGDVIVQDGDIFGDTVNVAARLEPMAEPGGICISRGVRDHIRKQRDLGFDDLGFLKVKNIAHPVSAFRVRFDPVAAVVVEAVV